MARKSPLSFLTRCTSLSLKTLPNSSFKKGSLPRISSRSSAARTRDIPRIRSHNSGGKMLVLNIFFSHKYPRKMEPLIPPSLLISVPELETMLDELEADVKKALTISQRQPPVAPLVQFFDPNQQFQLKRARTAAKPTQRPAKIRLIDRAIRPKSSYGPPAMYSAEWLAAQPDRSHWADPYSYGD